MRCAWLVVLFACGDNREVAVPVVDAGCGDACPPTCQVTLSGNVEERTSSSEACPTLRHGGPTDQDVILAFSIPSPALATSLGVQVDLGAMPVAGELGSETATVWSAVAIESVPPGGACVFLAGAMTTPTGYFTLRLASIDAAIAHGALAMTLAVLPRTTDQGVQTDCGASTTEVLEVAF
ncbi:hypothetical protein BH11MYX1_BH11MYX1_04650 [soil metagenome]